MFHFEKYIGNRCLNVQVSEGQWAPLNVFLPFIIQIIILLTDLCDSGLFIYCSFVYWSAPFQLLLRWIRLIWLFSTVRRGRMHLQTEKYRCRHQRSIIWLSTRRMGTGTVGRDYGRNGVWITVVVSFWGDYGTLSLTSQIEYERAYCEGKSFEFTIKWMVACGQTISDTVSVGKGEGQDALAAPRYHTTHHLSTAADMASSCGECEAVPLPGSGRRLRPSDRCRFQSIEVRRRGMGRCI